MSEVKSRQSERSANQQMVSRPLDLIRKYKIQKELSSFFIVYIIFLKKFWQQ